MVVTDVTSVSHNAMVEVQREWLVLVGGGIPSLLYFLNLKARVSMVLL